MSDLVGNLEDRFSHNEAHIGYACFGNGGYMYDQSGAGGLNKKRSKETNKCICHLNCP